jgi:2'-5' RNA ligase
VRLFVAIQIPEDIRASIASLLQEFLAIAPQIKWIRVGNLHITLKFLGETDPDRLSPIKESLASIHSKNPVPLDFSGLGFFPNAKRPNILWAGIQSSSNLQSIVSRIENQMHSLGYPKEDRAFTPHLTLARLDKAVLPKTLKDTIAQNSAVHFGNFIARDFHLIESKLKSTGAEYTTVQSFSFVSEA